MRNTDEATDLKSPRFAGPCPRCGGGVPTGAYPGALSRFDNATYICSECGTREALWQFEHGGYSRGTGGGLTPPTEPVYPYRRSAR